MNAQLSWPAPEKAIIANKQYNELREPRVGVMIHFDASGNDLSAVGWFRDPTCKVSYQKLVLDDGSYVTIAPDTKRAWHAGVCRPSNDLLKYTDANSAFYGVSIASNEKVESTALQMLTAAALARFYFELEGWSLDQIWRVVGHDTEAWPRGRKVDPTGFDKLNPILSVENIRRLVPRISLL
jgi:N-acetyl-anhydromuramyl-L-alanine amidase AmpD